MSSCCTTRLIAARTVIEMSFPCNSFPAMNSYLSLPFRRRCWPCWLLYQARLRLALSAAKHRSLAGPCALVAPHRATAAVLRILGRALLSRRCGARGGGNAAPRRIPQLAELFATRFARSAATDRRSGAVGVRHAVHGPLPRAVPVQPHRAREPQGRLVPAGLAGTQLTDLDGNQFYDLAGSYGVNVFGYDFYKECIERGAELVRELGPVLGTYHPVMAYNVRRLREISGLDEVSFHMSGTEAVMQAVRLARYHTGRRHLVRFCGAYHGWWGDVQPGVGNPATAHDTYTLKDMSEQTLRVLRMRRDIACVLVNPLQALHPNANAPSDGALVDSGRHAAFRPRRLRRLAAAAARGLHRARHRADLRRSVRRLPPGPRRRAGILRRARRHGDLRQDPRRRPAGRRGLRRAPT